MNNKKSQRRHENRDDLVGEHALGDALQLVLLVCFLVVWVLDSFVFKWSTFLADGFPAYIQIPLALLVLSGSGILARMGLQIVFGEVRPEPMVIRKGVFGIVRHPIYVACILFYLGMILTTLSLLSIAVWIVIVPFYYIISKYEEKLLLQKFGADYEDYMRSVPMWIPRLISAKSIINDD